MIKEKIRKYLSKFSYQAVCYAEEAVGKGKGSIKKEMAIDYLISKLPIYCQPFAPVLKTLLSKMLDELIEYAVKKLHEVQEQQKERLERQKNGQ